MDILHLTDIHANLEYLRKIDKKDSFGLIILSGDITHFGDKESMMVLVKSIKKEFSSRVLAVCGNCDYPNSLQALIEEGVSVQNQVLQYEKYQVCGIGGSLHCPGTTPNEFNEEEYTQILKNLESMIVRDKPLIFVSHQPPFKTKNDRVLFGMHVGSKTIRKFIEQVKPKLCFTGHIHEGIGIDFIGECPIINPGPFRKGKYAIVKDIGEEPPQIKIYE